MSKELPNTIHVMREEDGDDSFLIAGESLDDMNLERGEYTIVGKYVLEGIQKVTLRVSIPLEEGE